MKSCWRIVFQLVLAATLIHCSSDETDNDDRQAHCLIGDMVWPAGSLNPQNSCQVCSPEQEMDTWTTLADASFCANDQGLCQSGQCTLGICFIADTECTPCAHGTRSGCGECDTRYSLRQWTYLADGTACGENKECQAHQCLDVGSGPPPEDTTDAACIIGDLAYPASSEHPSNPCAVCDPTASTSEWTLRADHLPCDHGRGLCEGGICVYDQCYVENEPDCQPCAHGTRIGCGECNTAYCNLSLMTLKDGSLCDQDQGFCYQGACSDGGTCFIDGLSRDAGNPNPLEPLCQLCLPDLDLLHWSPQRVACQDPAHCPCLNGRSGCACLAGPTEVDCANGVDDDEDGFADCQDPDCIEQACDAVQTLTLTPEADVYVALDDAADDIHYGYPQFTYVRMNKDNYRALLQFQVQPRHYSSASLRLKCRAFTTADSIQAHLALHAWDELAITGSTMIEYTPIVLGTSAEVPVAASTQWVTISSGLLDVVQAWAWGEVDNNGFVLTGLNNTGTSAFINCDNNRTPNPIELHLSYQPTCNMDRRCQY